MSESVFPAAVSVSPYRLLKHAQALFGTTPDALSAEQQHKVQAVVRRSGEIERRILASAQAAHVVVDAAAIDAGVAEIAARFASADEFRADLARHGLSEDTLRAEVARELRVQAVLDTVSARIATVSNQDIEIFYFLHLARFQTPARRTLRHILVTINEDLRSNTRAQAHARITRIQALLCRQPERFADQALQHSECPTALQGGLLGQIGPGQLFPSLDEAAAQLRPGELSGVLESPLGFHILRCENLRPAGTVPLASVRERIREQITRARRENRQRQWLRSLMARA